MGKEHILAQTVITGETNCKKKVDINNLFWASSEARDLALRRKYRHAPGGDLHSQAIINIPAASYMTGADDQLSVDLANMQDAVATLSSGMASPPLEKNAGSQEDHPNLERKATSDSFVEAQRSDS